MPSAAWNPRIDFRGGADEDLWKRADSIIAALGDRVTDLGGGSWRVFEFDTPTQDQAVAALEQVLDEVDPNWRDVIAVVSE